MKKYECDFIIRVADVNYGGHLGNDKVLLYFHEARIRYLGALLLSEQDIGNCISIIQSEAFIKYLAEAFLGDKIKIYVYFNNFTKTRFYSHCEIIRKIDNITIATGYAILAGFDYKKRKLQRLPTSFIEKVNSFQNQS